MFLSKSNINMYRTLNKDNTKTEYFIVGARSQNSNLDIASIVLANYDDDTHVNYRLAEIAAKDNFGNSNLNGFGNLVFKTNYAGESNTVETKMTILYNGNVGIGVDHPDDKLVVDGNIIGSNIVYKNEPMMMTVNPVKIENATYTKAFSWIYRGDISYSRTLRGIDIRSFTDNAGTYDLRMYDVGNNIVYGGLYSLSNTVAEIYTMPLSNLTPNSMLELELQGRGSNVNIDAITLRYDPV
jgi:hypothetical protein